jgi:aryl-alcohol dehydrogenase-like predicted oxidoreductase
MDEALNLGFNFFDTANVYGFEKGKGVTEEIVGRWFARGERRRERVVLATKVYGSMGEGINERGLSAFHIREACEASLRRLKTDHIDLYQMHHVDRSAPWDEIWQAMEQLVQQGKVLYVGSSNFAGWHIAQAQGAASARRFLGLVSEQSLYNLNARTVELEVLPACRALGLGVLPWSPLAGGLLAGPLTANESGRRGNERLRQSAEKHRTKIEAYAQLCKEVGTDPATMAIAWLLQNPAVTAPIIGPRTLGQLTHALRSLELTLTKETLQRLDEIFPGPGGTAPEAYAW